MIKNPTVYVKVPVRYTRGQLHSESKSVKVATIDWRNNTMVVEYEADMFGLGVKRLYHVTLSLEAFRKRYRV